MSSDTNTDKYTNYLIHSYSDDPVLYRVLKTNKEQAKTDYDRSVIKYIALIYYHYEHKIPQNMDTLYNFLLRIGKPYMILWLVDEYKTLKSKIMDEFFITIEDDYNRLRGDIDDST